MKQFCVIFLAVLSSCGGQGTQKKDAIKPNFEINIDWNSWFGPGGGNDSGLFEVAFLPIMYGDEGNRNNLCTTGDNRKIAGIAYRGITIRGMIGGVDNRAWFNVFLRKQNEHALKVIVISQGAFRIKIDKNQNAVVVMKKDGVEIKGQSFLLEPGKYDLSLEKQ